MDWTAIAGVAGVWIGGVISGYAIRGIVDALRRQ